MDPVFQRLGDVTIQRLEKPKENKLQPQQSDEDTSEELPTTNKRPLDVLDTANKKFRADETFSDEDEFSDYDSESEMESEVEEEIAAVEKVEDKVEKDEVNSEGKKEECGVDGANGGEGEDYDYDIKEKLKEMGEISVETVKKGESKVKKSDVSEENEVVVTPAKKSGDEDGVAERKGGMLRRNIREVMDETKLDESTLAAQRQEMERLKRVNEQQRFIREVQRQLAQERMQNRVISLLQGNNTTKPVVTGASSGARIGNTVLVKLPNGQTKPMTKLSKRPFELLRIPKGAAPTTSTKHIRNLISMKKPATNLTPSVSIAPVSKKLPTVIPQRSHSDSDSEDGDEEFMRRPLPKPKPRPLPVTPQTPPQTIDISSDDDCIVVSETEGDPNTDEVEEDPSNSGMHTNDEFNQPDDQGRVVINIGHPEDEPDIYVAPQIARIIKPHQVGGVRFLFDNLIESIGRFESSTGFGCILAHSMGLGKTLQVVCFSDVFLRHTPARTILCIMPINTLQNWMAEFNMWLPTEEAAPNSPLNAHGEVRPRNFNLHVLNDSHKTLAARAKVIHQWKTDGGVLLIGYEQYRLLSMRKYPKSRKKQKEVERDDDKNKALFDEVHEALVKPGPDLVICDEGHRIKNSHASISQALKQMRTKRRVVLTGYPLQNNLMEYWCMVDFVRPNYLGTKTEFCNMFERPIQNGQCIDSTEADIKLMRYRAHVLHSLLVGFVQRRSHTVLQTALPQKQEYVLLVRMTPFQRELYETFMNEVVRIQAVPNPLKAFAVCCKIWNHPDVLYYFLKKRDAVDIDLEEVSSTAGSTEASGKANKKSATKKATKTKLTGKPEASVTPYSTTENQFPPPNTITSSNSNSSTGSFSSSSFGQSQSNNINPEQQQYNEYNHNYFHQTAKNKINYQNNYSENSGSCYSGQTFGQNSFGYPQQNSNFQQQYPPSYNNYNQQHVNNYWNQDEQSYQQTNDYYNNCKQNFNSPTNWIKKEDIKPLPTNTLINPIKSEGYNNSFGGDSKPKINIISDIKLSSVGKVSPEKKINILSDIKLEVKKEEDEKDVVKDEVKSEQPSTPLTDDDVKIVSDTVVNAKPVVKESKEDGGIPYDWATELLKDYIPGCIENSAKMEILFTIIRESIALGDRLLVFSQSLITLDLIEQFLQSNQVPGDTVKWCRNTSYYRLDGSTSALEREKLINEFNSNAKIHLFLVSTRAGSLGINLIGANRVVVLDASWNPCHDTQAVCRVYRYGQQKPCYVYRLVVDNCLEKKIYDRQINKQGMSDRVVDECNPDAHLTLKDVSTLCWDDNKEDPEEKDWSHTKDNYSDPVLKKVLESLGRRLNKEPFQHESLLVDRKDKQLSRQEKRLAKKGYEREKQASRQPMYNMAAVRGQRPIASVRPMQQGGERPSRWIPAEHWQRQGMTAQEMTLPLDVVIPTNQQDKGNIVLKAGQKVLVLKSPKGVYMQLESGKIVAIKTAIKVRGKAEDNDPSKMGKTALPLGMKSTSPLSVMQPKRTAKPFNPALAKFNIRSIRQPAPNLVSRLQNTHKKLQITPKSKPYTNSGSDLSKEMQDVHLGLDENESGQNDLIGLEDEETGEIQQNPITEQHRRFMGNPRNFRPNFAPTKNDKTQSSALQRLEQSTSAMMSDKQQPFQDTLDSITNATYHEEDKLDDHDSRDNSMDDAQDSLSDDVQHISDDQEQQPMRPGMKQPDIPQQQQDYTGYNYYNYNPYPAPPQTYPPAYHPTQAGYEMGYTPQPPPPPPQQYGYGMYPQSYAPPQVYHQPPHQPGFEYGHPPAPPQAMYPGYHNPYQQQYGAPPPPPPIYGAQPAPAAASSSSSYPAPEYQYGAQTAPVQQPFYPNT